MGEEVVGEVGLNVLFLDDNLRADTVAKYAGMQVCGVYDESSRDYVDQMKAATDFYIYDFQELLHLETDKKAWPNGQAFYFGKMRKLPPAYGKQGNR